jgi:hypothetical protein
MIEDCADEHGVELSAIRESSRQAAPTDDQVSEQRGTSNPVTP